MIRFGDTSPLSLLHFFLFIFTIIIQVSTSTFWPVVPAQSNSWPASALSCPSLGWHVSPLLRPPLSVLVEHRVLTILYLCVSRLALRSLPVTSEADTLWGWRGLEQLQASPLGALNGMWVTLETVCPRARRNFSSSQSNLCSKILRVLGNLSGPPRMEMKEGHSFRSPRALLPFQ